MEKSSSYKGRQVGGGNHQKVSSSSAMTFDSNNVVKIEMAGGDEELVNVEIEEIDDDNDCDLQMSVRVFLLTLNQSFNSIFQFFR